MLQLDLHKHPLTLTLGSRTLPVNDYQLKTEMLVTKRVLCGGEVMQTVCGEYPCTLTVSGEALTAECGELLAALTAEMLAHTEFDFAFAGMAFDGMQITAAAGKFRSSDGVTEFTLTLTGGLGE